MSELQTTPKPKKSVALLGRHRRQHRALHRRAHRQRPALPRLRHPRHRRALRIRGDRLPAGARQAADRGRARRLQGEAEVAARPAGRGAAGAGGAAGRGASDGRDAHRRLGARLRAAGEGRPQPRRRARHRRPADGVARLDAALLVSLRAQRPAHRGRDRRRLDRRRTSCTCCTARPPPRAWVRAMHTSLILYAEHEFNASTFTAASSPAPARTCTRRSPAAIGALRGPKHGGANEVAFEIQQRYATPDEAEADIAAASPTRRWSSASATRSTRSPIRATRSSRKSRAASRRRPAR